MNRIIFLKRVKMLIAAAHKKDRSIKKEKLVLVEDEITSSILGPLSYMDVGNI